MPWGINRNELAPTLRCWHKDFAGMKFLDYHVPRGLPHLLNQVISHVPVVRNEIPSLVHIAIAAKSVPRHAIFYTARRESATFPS
jgi:hypothetical protein